ncbi:hypothetical protein V1477_003956 [Vespula maculifrons]|uniref:Uncharacterized protein n=1 Tax=Vespula maculifrons TaxID=7453 RepID=A0ABD2CSF1_VESMC
MDRCSRRMNMENNIRSTIFHVSGSNEEAPKYRFELFGPKDSREKLCSCRKHGLETTIIRRGKQCAVGRQRVPTSTPCVSMRTTPTAKLAPDYTSSPLANFPLFRTASASFVGDHPPPSLIHPLSTTF